MKKLSLRKRHIFCSVLSAAVAMLTAVLSTAVPYRPVYAAQTGSTDEETHEVGGEILNDVLGELVFYRWQKMTKDNYPKDGKWHPVLTFWANNSKVLNAVAPEDVYLEDSHPVIEGANWFGRNGIGDFPLSHYNDERFSANKGTNLNVEPIGAAALKAHDTANDKELRNNAGKDVFYTSGDKNCMFVKYAGIEDETKCPYFTIRLSNGKGSDPKSGSNSMGDYVINLINGKEYASGKSVASGKMMLTSGDARANGYEDIVFQTQDNGLVKIFDSNYDYSDVELVLQDGYFIGEAVFGWSGFMNNQFTADADSCTVYFGEAFRYSAIPEDTTVNAGQILSISPTDYVDAKGNEQSQNGVMLPNGRTLTVEKGGILCISGDFINNGTIINNGGTILIKEGGNLFPFRTGSVPAKNGCGTVKCLGGDIIINKGGALYAGMNDESGNIVPFYLDENSTLINQGLLVYGSLRLGESARVEAFSGSKTYGSWYMADISQDQTNTKNIDDEMKNKIMKQMKDVGELCYYDEKAEVIVSLNIHSTRQLDMLPKYNSYFLNNNAGSVPSQLKQSSTSFPGFNEGAYLPEGISETKKPHFLASSSATVNDPYSDSRLKRESLTI